MKKQFYTDEGERNIKLEQIVSSGSFPKVFNAIQQDIAPILEPPEKTEDVHGEWIEYQLGDEDDIARAAKGTGWCVASLSVGRHYLEYGTYGDDDNEDYDDYDSYDEDYENDNNSRQNRSKFILFHLIDKKTGKLSKNACASIRLDPDGNVAEISGLKDGQALNDSLVPIVEEKVKSLPGGEKFLEAFADKQKLIALDRKMQNGEDLTKEELEFLYEIHRPIQILDTYNDCDPRVNELKQKYDIDYALDAGINIDSFISNISPLDIVHNLDAFISHGASIDMNELVSRIGSLDDIIQNLDTLISYGADIDQLVSDMDSSNIDKNIDNLMAHGANVDHLVSKMSPNHIIWHLDDLLPRVTDINSLISSKMDPYDIATNLDTLIAHGADIDINDIVSNLDPGEILDNLDTLLSHGASINIDNLISKVDAGYIIRYRLDTLLSHGANIKMEDLVSRVKRPDEIADNLDTLLSHGANVNQLISKMYPFQIDHHFETLINHGANINQLVPRMTSDYVCFHLDDLIGYGAKIDIDELVSKMSPHEIEHYLRTLLNHGASINQIISKMDPEDVVDRLRTLLRYGADINQIISKIPPEDVDSVRNNLQHM